MHMEIQQTDQFRKWLHRLRDHAAKAGSLPGSDSVHWRDNRSAICTRSVKA